MHLKQLDVKNNETVLYPEWLRAISKIKKITDVFTVISRFSLLLQVFRHFHRKGHRGLAAYLSLRTQTNRSNPCEPWQA
jgi:hypothetical protein